MSKQLLGAVLIAVASFIALGFILPNYQNLGDLNEVLEDRQIKIAELQSTVNNISDLGFQIEDQTRDVDRLQSLVSEERQPDELLSAVEEIARLSGMELTRVAFADLKTKEPRFKTIQARLDLNGTYPVFTGFLENLERSLRLFDVVELAITSKLDGTIGVELKFNTYHIK